MTSRIVLAALASFFAAGPALAHPHIFIDAEIAVVFDAQGAVSRLDHSWTFDSFFSAWTVQGLDADGDGTTSPEELQGLADENMLGLAEYGFYTYADIDGTSLAFAAAGTQSMRYESERVTLDFSVVPDAAVPTRGRLELAVNDPEYYVAITFADAGTVTLENAPEGCTASLVPPEPMASDVEEQLYALGPEVLELPPELAAAMRGTQGLIAIDCPGGAAPVTALEATETLAEARPAAPFGGPPPEPGLNLPQTGFFGWLQEQQRSFYRAMTEALGAFRSDGSAFWLLGALSFAYGVFHAAGPGHGKVVIGAYMLANEQAVRRGIALSFASALMQSLVAIVFVLAAAGIIGMTSLAMGEAAHWIGVLSYALVLALGLWLVARKLFGWGDHHHHDDLAHKAHAHLHEHDHHHHHSHDHHDHQHIVTPEVANKSWREQLGVVAAVGIRPCSGALVVMVFALSQGVLMAGIAAVLLMGIGTGITVAVLASLAVWGKGLARGIGGIDNPVTARIVWWVELLGAVAVAFFGFALLVASL